MRFYVNGFVLRVVRGRRQPFLIPCVTRASSAQRHDSVLRTFSAAGFSHRREDSPFRNRSRNLATESDLSVVSSESAVKQVWPIRTSKRAPFVKNLFLGRFDKDVLTYPQVLDKERLQTLDEMVEPVARFFRESVDSKAIDRDGKIPESVLETIRQMGLFGQQVPVEYGGLGLNATEFARLAEITALDGGIVVTLAAHQSIGLKGILIAGNEQQKQKYLPKLASGELIAAFCLTEHSSGSDAASIKTRATLSDDGKTFLLNGGKIWISNGGIADVFTVFAKTKVQEPDGIKDKITAFIVERGFDGVTSGPPEDKMGIRGSNTSEVNFENTPVPVENVIGEVGEGFKIAMNILNSGRFSLGSSCAGSLKWLMSIAVDHAINRNQFDKPLKDFELIQEKFAKASLAIYAMESMAYLTAGLLDSQDHPDCSVEAAIVKVFSSEAAWNHCSELLQIMGGHGFMKAYPFERVLRDSRILLIFEGTNEVLRMFIALMGCQHAGKELAEVVRKLRTPLANPTFTLQTAWKRRLQEKDKPNLTLDLKGHLHPSLSHCAQLLEYGTMRFQYAVELALERYGKNITEKQMALRRLADIVIDLYAITACLGRASRSHCIGLHNSDIEIVMAEVFTKEAITRIKANVIEIQMGDYATNDLKYKRIADSVFKKMGYCAAHPLTQNY